MMIGEAALPARDCRLSIVSGAPGAGKSAAVAALLRLRRAYLVFDADWLLPDCSTLTGRAIAEAVDLWPPYRRLWLTIARLIGQNERRVVLFIPLEPGELAAVIPDDWRGAVRGVSSIATIRRGGRGCWRAAGTLARSTRRSTTGRHCVNRSTTSSTPGG